MSLVRKTSVAAAAVTGLVLVLTATLLAAGASSSAAESGPRQQAGASWVSAARFGAVRAPSTAQGARFRTFTDRVLGAQPVLSYRGFADPTVARYAGGWVGISTGPSAPRAVAPQPGGPWQDIPSALLTRPSWALSQRFWADDLVQVGGLWLLYFSAEVAGVGIDGRCIGVATATDPTQTFVPDERPLVCPRQAAAPPAYDKIKRRGRDMPKSGVIDPDYFKDRGGQAYLSYRTQSTPSSIRLVPLPPSGRPEGPPQRSTELVRRRGVIENPTLLRRGRQYVLLSSEGEFGECSYKTTFRRSTKLDDWSRAERQVLIDTRKSGLCGPGGADLGRGPSGEPMLFLHAWTCPALGNCPGGHNYDRENLYDARRSLFAATLRFTSRQSPRVASYVAPVLPPPPPPPPAKARAKAPGKGR